MILRNASLLGMQTQSIYWCLLRLPNNPAYPLANLSQTSQKLTGQSDGVPGQVRPFGQSIGMDEVDIARLEAIEQKASTSKQQSSESLFQVQGFGNQAGRIVPAGQTPDIEGPSSFGFPLPASLADNESARAQKQRVAATKAPESDAAADEFQRRQKDDVSVHTFRHTHISHAVNRWGILQSYSDGLAIRISIPQCNTSMSPPKTCIARR